MSLASTSLSCFYVSLVFVFRSVIITGLKLTKQLGCLASKPTHLPRICLLHYRLQACYDGCCGSNSGPHVCKASTPPTELSLQLCNNLFRSLRFHLYGGQHMPKCVWKLEGRQPAEVSLSCYHIRPGSRSRASGLAEVALPTEPSCQAISAVLLFLTDIQPH